MYVWKLSRNINIYAFLYAKIQRIQNFFTKQPKKNWPLNYEQIIDIAKSVQNEG